MKCSAYVPKRLVRWWSAVANCASKDGGRVVLTGVLVQVGWQRHPLLGEYVGVSFTATDSYRLLSVAIPAYAGTASDPSQASVVVGGVECHSVLIPAAAVKVGVSDGLSLEWETADGGAIAAGSDVVVVSAKGKALISPVEGGAESFPNWCNLIPSGDIGRLDPFAVNGAYLGGMLSDMAKASGSGLTSPVRIISAAEGRKPVRVDCVGDGFAACGIVMPVRVPTDGGDVLGHLPTVEGAEGAAVGS